MKAPTYLICTAVLSTLCGILPLRAEEWIDDEALKTRFETQLGQLYQDGIQGSGPGLRKQLSRVAATELPLPRLSPSADRSGPAGIASAREATLVLGHLYPCKECGQRHARLSGGVVVHPDGLVLTCYHVIDSSDALIFGAMTAAGELYPIEAVLAASKKDDLALVQLRGAKHLAAAPLAREGLQIGEELFVLSHPDGHFFSLTRGHLSRRYLSSKEGVPRLQLTADFAQGSSGCGIFNLQGELVGLAVSTSTILYHGEKEEDRDLQMVIKAGVPLESMRRLFKAGTEPPLSPDP